MNAKFMTLRNFFAPFTGDSDSPPPLFSEVKIFYFFLFLFFP